LKIRFLEETESVVIIFKAKDAYPYKEKLKSFGWKFNGRDKTWNFKESGTASKIKKTFIKILSISRSSGWLVTYSGKIPGEFVKIALGQE